MGNSFVKDINKAFGTAGQGGAVAGGRLGLFGGPAGAVAGSVIGGTLGYLSSLVGYEKLLDNLNEKKMLYTPTYNEIGEFVGFEQGIERPEQEKFISYLFISNYFLIKMCYL